METPGGNRRAFLTTVATRTRIVADTECDHLHHVVVATIVGFRPHILLIGVTRPFALCLCIAQAAVQVTLIRMCELVFWFADPQVCFVNLNI